MPRRQKPDPLARTIGERIRSLREASGLTLEKLAFESDLGSKGHLSDIERGLVRPNVRTLRVLADRLGVLLLDLVTFPADDLRQALIDRTRGVPKAVLRKLLAAVEKSQTSPGRPRATDEEKISAAERSGGYRDRSKE